MRKPRPFERAGRRLPGQSTDDALGVTLRQSFKVYELGEVEFLQIGRIGAGDYLELSADAFTVYGNALRKLVVENDGGLRLGIDVDQAAETHLAIFAVNQSYNGESVAAGDMLLGDNSGGKANLYWDRSEGRLKLRGGTGVQAYVDTDGTLTAGGGNVSLNGDGIALNQGNASTNRVKIRDGEATIVELGAATDPGVAVTGALMARGAGSETHEAILTLAGRTDDGQPHDGAAAVTLELDTANDRASVSAGLTHISGSLTVNEAGSAAADVRMEGDTAANLFFLDASADAVGINQSSPNAQASLDIGGAKAVLLPRLTTAQRDALTAAAGMVIYNTSTNTFQGRTNLGWINL